MYSGATHFNLDQSPDSLAMSPRTPEPAPSCPRLVMNVGHASMSSALQGCEEDSKVVQQAQIGSLHAPGFQGHSVLKVFRWFEDGVGPGVTLRRHDIQGVDSRWAGCPRNNGSRSGRSWIDRHQTHWFGSQGWRTRVQAVGMLWQPCLQWDWGPCGIETQHPGGPCIAGPEVSPF